MTEGKPTNGWKLRSTRHHEPRDKWFEIQTEFVGEYLKQAYATSCIGIKLMGDLWIYYDCETNDVYATIDGEKGETLVY